ncbi:hypothetical protein [Streptomyces sp. NPDC001404]|uniref:hypothetical protein n=1 Tax=Streptomyces sp. NPDC001404 TaxID=3364571 RepID=UPI003691C11D
MTMYAPSDVRSIFLPSGCGEPHTVGELQAGEHWALDCPACETVLAAPALSKLGWSPQEDGVALTPDERRLLETEKNEGHIAQALMAKEFGRELAARTRTGPETEQSSNTGMIEALKSASPEDLAELLTRAGLAPQEDKPAPRKRAARKPPVPSGEATEDA